MTPDLRHLLEDVRRFLRSLESLLNILPARMRTQHLAEQLRDLNRRVDDELRKSRTAAPSHPLGRVG